MADEISKKEREWIKKGVDIWLIRDNLKASYETRVERHQDTLNCIDALMEIGRLHHAKSPKTSSDSHPKSA